MALQPCDLDRGMVVAVHHTGALAQHFHRAGLSATAAKDIRIQNPQCRAAKVPGTDALDKARNVNMRGTCAGARRVKTIQATIGFKHGSLRLKRRFDVAESLAEQ